MPALWTVNLFVNRKTDRKIKTPNYCKVLYKKDFSTASNFYTKIFQIQKNLRAFWGLRKNLNSPAPQHFASCETAGWATGSQNTRRRQAIFCAK